MYLFYLKSVLRYQFSILDTSQADNPYFREQRCEDPWLFFEGGPRAKKFGKSRLAKEQKLL